MMAWYDVIGIFGVACVLGSYLLLHLEKINSKAPLFSFANALGAGLILVSLYFDFNLSAALIEGAWLTISLFGLFKSLRRDRL